MSDTEPSSFQQMKEMRQHSCQSLKIPTSEEEHADNDKKVRKCLKSRVVIT